jgi:hypothetical protein
MLLLYYVGVLVGVHVHVLLDEGYLLFVIYVSTDFIFPYREVTRPHRAISIGRTMCVGTEYR